MRNLREKEEAWLLSETEHLLSQHASASETKHKRVLAKRVGHGVKGRAFLKDTEDPEVWLQWRTLGEERWAHKEAWSASPWVSSVSVSCLVAL